MTIRDVTGCPSCEWSFEDGCTPIDPDWGTCWACIPCACGGGCGFAAGLIGTWGIKVCETQIPDNDLNDRRIATLRASSTMRA